MTKNELIDAIEEDFDRRYKWQKLVYGVEFNREAAEAMSLEELQKYYDDSCKGAR